jgi:hypothetical protein
MFDSLADQMRHDAQEQTNNRERWIRWSLVAVVSILVFAGLYLGVHLGGG